MFIFDGFRPSRSTAYLLIVVSDRVVSLDMFQHFDRVWYAELLHKLKSSGISGWVFDLI